MSFLEKFRRVGSQEYIPQIDGLRFLAILPVVLMHFRTAFIRNSGLYDEVALGGHNLLNDILLTGSVGVPIFFVISGFILGVPFAKSYSGMGKDISLKKYFLRRLTRLEPPFIITLCLFFVIHIILHTAELKELIKHFLATLIYSHMLIYRTWSLINPVTWSLEVEIQFYILVPLITRVFFIKNAILRRGIILGFLFFFLTLKKVYGVPPLTILDYAHYFILGFLLVDIYLYSSPLSIKPVLLDVLGVIGLFSIFASKYYDFEFITVFAIFIVFISAFYGFYMKKLFAINLITLIGGMCYTTYLVHYPLAIFLNKLFHRFIPNINFDVDFFIMAIFLVPLIFILSAILFLFIEKPFMYFDWPQKTKAWIKTKIFRTPIEAVNTYVE